MKGNKVFDGLKVADFAWVAVGPLVGQLLASFGATVVKVECHRYPDMIRVVGPFKDGISGINRGPFGTLPNANKYGISLDINKPRGQEVAKKLVAWADLVSDSMTPGTMAKWGLDYESCRKIKPDIIYYSTTMMGQHGPLNRFAGYGLQGAAYAGFCELTGLPDREPLTMVTPYTDLIAPQYLIVCVIAALLRRRKTGKGMYFDQSQVEAGITCLAPLVLDYVVNQRIASRMGSRDPYVAPHGTYPCRGVDRWVAIAVSTHQEWRAFCQVIGEPDWTKDPKFATLLARKENEDELDRLIGEWTKDYTAEQIMAMMQDAGVPAGVVETWEDAGNDPQLKHREHFNFLEHKEIGRHAYHSPAFKLSKTPAELRKASPCLGEDNEYVYQEILGLSDDEIAELLAEGAITTEADAPATISGL